jgi:CYTH domain-containing protein
MMLKEVEIKALLTEERYRYLKTLLPHKFTKINEDTVTTVKFKPTDVRVRYSDKMREVVFKGKDNPSAIERNEFSISLKDMDDCNKMIALLEGIGLSQHPQWTTHKEEFILTLDDHDYTLSLQDIPNFAYILEAEIITDEPEKHLPKLKKILSGLGCEPIDPQDFNRKVEEYRVKYKK